MSRWSRRPRNDFGCRHRHAEPPCSSSNGPPSPSDSASIGRYPAIDDRPSSIDKLPKNPPVSSEWNLTRVRLSWSGMVPQWIARCKSEGSPGILSQTFAVHNKTAAKLTVANSRICDHLPCSGYLEGRGFSNHVFADVIMIGRRPQKRPADRQICNLSVKWNENCKSRNSGGVGNRNRVARSGLLLVFLWFLKYIGKVIGLRRPEESGNLQHLQTRSALNPD